MKSAKEIIEIISLGEVDFAKDEIQESPILRHDTTKAYKQVKICIAYGSFNSIIIVVIF